MAGKTPNRKHSDSEEEIFSKLPCKLVEKLMTFQKDGVRFAIRKNGRCLIADEMGLGKTLQAISVAYYYRNEWPLLIIVPSSLRFCWVEELEKWIPDIHPKDIYLVQTGNDASGIPDAKISITTYGLLCKTTSRVILEALNNQNFKVVIVDESHYIKNQKTASCKAVVPLIKNASRRILLSGTPSLARPVELYPQIDAVCPDKFGTWWSFTGRYCDARIERFGNIKRRKVDGASNLEELQQRLASTLMIRRLKSDVLTQLPAKQRQRILFDLKDSDLKKDIKKVFGELKPLLSKNKSADGSIQIPNDKMSEYQANGLIMKLFNMSGEAKFREYVEMLCENQNLKFLVFAYHHAMMNGIQQTLFEKKIRFVRIDGETKSSDRQMYVHQFQSDPDIKVAILSILAAGVGLTLTAASLVVFAEMYWTPGVLIQCEDRAHRIGQNNCVSVHYLVAKGTVDEWVWSAIGRKTIVTTTALDGKKKELEADHGDKYQINILSNADVYVKPDNEDVDLSQMLSSQQPRDQRSILDFMSNRKRKNSEQSSESKRKRSAKETDNKNICKNAEDSITISDEEQDTAIEENEDMISKGSEWSKSDIADISLITPKRRQSEQTPCKIVHKVEINCVKSSSGCHKDVQNRKTNSAKKEVIKQRTCEKIKLIEGLTQKDDDDFVESGSIFSSKKKNNKNSRTNERINKSGSSSKSKIPASQKNKNKPNVTRKNLDFSVAEDGNHGDVMSAVDDVSDLSVSCKINLNEWSCDACTFLNHADLPFCEICNTPKKKKHQKNCDTKMNEGKTVDLMSSENQDNITSLPFKESNLKTESEQNEKDCLYEKDLANISFDKPREVEVISETSVHNNELVNTCLPLNSNLDTSKIDTISNGLDNEQDESVINSPETTSKYFVNRKKEMNSEQKCKMKNVSFKHDHSSSPMETSNKLIDVVSLSSTAEKSAVEMSLSSTAETSITSATEMSLLSMPAKKTAAEMSLSSMPDENSIASTSEMLEYNDSLDMFDDNWETEVLSQGDITQECNDIANPEERKVVDISTLPVYKMFQYCCSRYTGRVYLYDQAGNSLNSNFMPLDVELGNQDNLPDIILHPFNMKLVQRFVREWNSLTETKRRLIMKNGNLFISPIREYEDVRSGKTSCTQRHRTKEDTALMSVNKADEIQGSVRIISKPKDKHNLQTKSESEPEQSDRGTVQAINKDGVPLCLNCFKPYTNSLLQQKTITSKENAWVTRLCSQECMDKYWMKTNAQYCREKVYEAEHGKCQKCGYDAHALFKQIRDTADVKKRAEILNKTNYCTLKPKQREQMVRHPTEGQFWHADHIKPVWEGGGECDIDNLRTLCVLCHMKVTAEQAKKRAHVRRLSSAAGAGDITAFFQPVT